MPEFFNLKGNIDLGEPKEDPMLKHQPLSQSNSATDELLNVFLTFNPLV